MASNGIIYSVQRKISCHPGKWKWDITPITSTSQNELSKYAVLILNRPITQKQECLIGLWNNARVKITVDGGTMRWDKYISNLSQEVQKSLKIPTLVTGDFDSITTDILEKYKTKGCKVVHTPDQDYTDFTKALMELRSYCKDNNVKVDFVIAVVQSSGRLDHLLGNIQTLFLNKEHTLLHPNTALYIMSDDSMSWLLLPGQHEITVPEETRTHKRAWCSLVPIGEPCESVSTTGLKWNLDNQPLKFGELVSTSNTFCGSDTVTVKCSHTLLWSMRIPGLMNRV